MRLLDADEGLAIIKDALQSGVLQQLAAVVVPALDDCDVLTQEAAGLDAALAAHESAGVQCRQVLEFCCKAVVQFGSWFPFT